MGLFDFVKDVGRQIFDTDAEAADNIKQHLEIKTHGLSNLDVQFDDGTVTICGDCSSEAVREQAILVAGNIQGVEKVVADDLKAPEAARLVRQQVLEELPWVWQHCSSSPAASRSRAREIVCWSRFGSV